MYHDLLDGRVRRAYEPYQDFLVRLPQADGDSRPLAEEEEKTEGEPDATGFPE